MVISRLPPPYCVFYADCRGNYLGQSALGLTAAGGSLLTLGSSPPAAHPNSLSAHAQPQNKRPATPSRAVCSHTGMLFTGACGSFPTSSLPCWNAAGGSVNGCGSGTTRESSTCMFNHTHTIGVFATTDTPRHAPSPTFFLEPFPHETLSNKSARTQILCDWFRTQ